MKKHFLLAAVMTPFLAFIGYALTDWYLKKDHTPTALKTLTVSSPCDLSQGCTLYNGDFTLTLKRTDQALNLKADQRLKGAMVEVVGITPLTKAKQADPDGYQWTLSLPKADPIKQIRMVVQSHWQNYIGEINFNHGH